VKRFLNSAALILLLSTLAATAERINQEGRILGTLPAVTNSILFNTNDADAIVSAMQVFPVTNPWNEDISKRPLLANSDAMITQINSDVGANTKLKLFQEMNFVLVPDNQQLISNKFITYPGDSDFNGGISPYGLYPTPTNMPIEEWPTGTGSQTLVQWQANNNGDDRHSIIVQPGAGKIYETWKALRNATKWQAANGAIFDLNTNGLRPDGYTSGDAAGFPMFPALVRYDECERGMVEHACRLVVVHSRQEHIYPARHDAGSVADTDTNYPAMGQRLRLKASFVIPATWTKEEKALALGLKKYGAMVSDNSSSFFSISITPDDRWANVFTHLTGSSAIAITNFEVIQSTGPNEGPRSPGAPTVNAGADQAASLAGGAQLQGVVNSTSNSLAIQWKLYSGPGTVTFANASLTNTTATFNTPGVYTLMLSADDTMHAVAYDAVIITVTSGLAINVTPNGTNVALSWTGGSPPYVLQQAYVFPANSWDGVVTTSMTSASVPLSTTNHFFRVLSTGP
jgi:hypothetical protein